MHNRTWPMMSLCVQFSQVCLNVLVFDDDGHFGLTLTLAADGSLCSPRYGQLW